MGVKADFVNFMAVGVNAGVITEEQAVEIYEEVDNVANTFEETPDKVKAIAKHIGSIYDKLHIKGY